MPQQVRIINALSKLPNPVAVLLVNDQQERNGMIASWMTQVSYDPPQILVAVRPNRYTHAMLHAAGFFTLNLLQEDQADRVSQFKLKGDARDEKFAQLEVAEDANGQPYLPDSAAVFHCRVVQVVETGDHTLFVGEVLDAGSSDARGLSTITLGKGYSGRG